MAALTVDGLSKCYHIYDKPRDRLLQMLSRGRRQYFREFWALRNVSFEVRAGETVGILGFNGAGKSTLLQLICGTLNPTSGSVSAKGRIAALLELGAGFNPEFTGRENVYMNYALHGIGREETEARFDAIADFAAIGDFIDQPVKVYSSGMFARLAFAAAVHVEPDILIVDEALSVGDMAFQEKSITRMKEIRAQGTSILFVTHSISAVRNFCDRALWLDQGQVRAYGERLAICDAYQDDVEAKVRSSLAPPRVTSGGEGAHDGPTLRIVSVRCDRTSYPMGADIHIEIALEFYRNPPRHGIGVIVHDARANVVAVLNTLRDGLEVDEPSEVWTLTIRDHHFAPGEYDLTVSIPDDSVMFSYDKREHCERFRVPVERNAKGLATVEGIVRCEHAWQSQKAPDLRELREGAKGIA